MRFPRDDFSDSCEQKRGGRRPGEQSRDCEEISGGVEEGALLEDQLVEDLGGRVVQREDHEPPEDVQRSLRSRELDQRKQAYEEDGGGNAALAPRPGPLMAARGSGSSLGQQYTDDGARPQAGRPRAGTTLDERRDVAR